MKYLGLTPFALYVLVMLVFPVVLAVATGFANADGEFTLDNLTALVQASKSDPYTAVILSLLSLLFAFVLLAVIGRVGAGHPQNRTTS